MRVLVIADTHIPKRARDLPVQIWHEVQQADAVVHAGDWVSLDLLDRLSAAAPRLIGCFGNNDGPQLRSRLPEVAQAELGGVRLVVVHETGGAKGREARLDRRFPDADLVLFGHSHIPWDTTSPNGMRLLNPGSPTDRRRQPVGTYLTLKLDSGRTTDVTLHPVSGMR